MWSTILWLLPPLLVRIGHRFSPAMCAAQMCSSLSAIPISAPQKQRARPSAVWVGRLQRASYIAYFHAVDAR